MNIQVHTINGPVYLTGGENDCSYARHYIGKYTVIDDRDEGEMGVVSGNGETLQDAIEDYLEVML